MEFSDSILDGVVENLVVESENLMPNILEIQVNTFFRFGRKKMHNRSQHHFAIHVSQIQCDLKDVAYYIKKKQGFPRLEDTGLMDIFLGGQGLSFNMELATADAKDRNRIFKLENVKVKIQNLNIVLKKSNHLTLFNLFKPLLKGLVKPAIAKAAETHIRRSFDQLDEQLWLVQKEYNKTKEAAKDQPPEEAANVIKMYVQAAQKRLTELKQKSQEKSKDTKVLLYYSVTNMRSILPTPRRPQSSPMFIFRAVSLPRPLNIARWFVKERNGVLPSSISAQPEQLPISQPPGRLLASRLTRTHALVSMTVRELQLPLENMEPKILFSMQKVLQLVIRH
jgi:Family of unknown function (DUF5923)/Protein of unknown function (DUF4449)